MKLKSIKRTIFFFLFVSVFSLLNGCVASNQTSGIKGDLWTGKITGMADGDVKMNIQQVGGKENEQLIKGQITLKVENYGQSQGTLNGRIKDGLVKARISGIIDGYSYLGEMIGAMSESQSSGTWSVDLLSGRYEGKWTAQKK